MGDRDHDVTIQWMTILRITLAGLICVLYVAGWARVGQLREESRRLERLIAAEAVRQGELAHRRAEACSTLELEAFAADRGMVKAPVLGRAVVIAPLPSGMSDGRHSVADATENRTRPGEVAQASGGVGAP